MNDEKLMQRLRDADPAAGRIDLQGADRDLLEQIVAAPAVDPRSLAASRRKQRIQTLTSRTRLLVPIAAAAVVGAAILVPQAMQDEQAPRTDATTSAPSPSADVKLPVTKVRYSAAAVRVAKANPRLLITADGWKVRSLGGFSPTSGEMSFQLGPDRWVEREIDADGNELSSTPLENPDSATPGGSDVTEVDNEAPQVNVDWYPAAEYDSYLADRAQQKTEQVDVLGQQVALVTYGPTDHAFMLRPEGGLFLEVRSSQLSRAEFLSLMNDHAEKVSVRDWLAAMPAEMVTADNADGRLKKVLTGVPTPPGFKGADMGQETALDSYQFGAKVAGAVTCGWIQEWEQARTAGDTARATKAADALATSRDWQFLQDMDAEGDYPEVVWEIADQVTAGEQPEGYRGALGCS